jgi:hypothetical protein
MTPASRLPSLLLAALLLVFATLTAVDARAGTLQIRDDFHALSGDDAARLRSVASDAPFDARVVFTSKYADSQELSRYVESLVNERDMIAIGVDPEHHHVRVHYGTGSAVPRSAWPDIDRAGNDAFRRGDWEGGTAAILRQAAASATGAADGRGEAGDRAIPTPAPRLAGPGFVLFVVAGVVGLGLVVAFVMRRRSQLPPGGPDYGAPPYGGGGYGYGGGYGPGPAPGGMGAMGGGLIGAGLGGVAGYELGKLEGEREERDRDRGGGGFRDDDDDRSGGGNYDAGGGGSDWDDSGSGGGDDGGGGFDGGDGGGSDF